MESKHKVLVIGESCFDVTLTGDVKRLNPEAPTPIITNPKKTVNKGMAENVVNNLKSLSPGIKVDFITQKEKITKTRYVDNVSKYILLRMDNDPPIKPLNKKLKWNIMKIINHKMYDVIVISDYNKGFLLEYDISAIGETAKNNEIPVFMDTKKILGAWSQCVTFVKINEKEYKANEEKLRGPYPEFYCDNLIVTLGEKGMKWDNQIYPAPKVEVRDVCGCGDVALAGLVIAGLQPEKLFTNKKQKIENMIFYANKTASIAASKPGVVSVTEKEVWG